ncbi:zinc ABC transporter substrate-binding protein [Candidatus Saccharibacteria bacterium]|nr:zinc ABC transporter substrate-binding protein [Candidatus Saccharibacteria bacterium]
MRKIALIVSLVVLIALISGFLLIKNKGSSDDSVVIITTSFPEYDFVRAVTGEAPKMLLKPGNEIHHFEPTPQDIIDIKSADFIVYGGGESEEWMDDLLMNNDIDDSKILSLLDIVEPDLNGDEEDEHVWTSPVSAIEIVETLRDELSEIWPEKAEDFKKNTDKYIAELQDIDKEFRAVVDSARTKQLVFADRFPFYYFAKEYGLNYVAAFPGCAEQTEASSKTVAELIDKIKADNLGVVLKIELSNGKLADAIANETGARVMELNSAHNVSQADFDNGVTYVDIMHKNVEVLKEALK